MQIRKEVFGYLADGRAVTRYMLRRDEAELAVLDFGAAIQSFLVPDKNGEPTDVVCGFDCAEFYDADTFQGVVVGRYANRIAGASVFLDGTEYRLSKNDGENHLHGGACGFQRRFWRASILQGENPAISLSLHSPDGDEGYPGNLDVTVVYELLPQNTLSVRFLAQSDQKTVVNLINHVAFQLGGPREKNVRDHVLWLDADAYLPTQGLLPTGEIRSVEGSVFDFRTPKSVGRDLDAPCLQQTRGFDTCLRFARRGSGLLHRATLTYPPTGIEMRMYTDLPAMQLYCGNYYTDPTRPFKGNFPQCIHHGICLEAGMMPDSPHHPTFTDTTLSPGEIFDHRILFNFSKKRS